MFNCSKSILRSLTQIRTTSALNKSTFRSYTHSHNHTGSLSCNSHLDHSSGIQMAFNQRSKIVYVPTRGIYGPSFLGIDKLDNLRRRRTELFQTGKDRYIERLAGYIESGDTKSIITEDLINLIALAENDGHLDLLEKVAILTKDNFEANWGSAVMRLYYKMNAVDRAVNNIKDEEKYGRFFCQRTAYMIALTMLFEAGRYEEVQVIYKLALNRLDRPDGVDNRSITLPVIAALVKTETPEAFKQALELYHGDTNNRNSLRIVSLMTYMAINNGDPKQALNLLSEAGTSNHIILRELKVLALARLGRYEDALFHLRRSLGDIKKRGYKLTTIETVNMMDKAKGEIKDEKVQDELEEILKDLKQNDLVGDCTLESLLFKPVDRTNMSLRRRDDPELDSKR